MKIYLVAFSDDELADGSPVTAGDSVHCRACGGAHPLAAGTDASGQPVHIMLFYRCGEKAFLGAVKGQLLPGVEPVAAPTAGATIRAEIN